MLIDGIMLMWSAWPSVLPKFHAIGPAGSSLTLRGVQLVDAVLVDHAAGSASVPVPAALMAPGFNSSLVLDSVTVASVGGCAMLAYIMQDLCDAGLPVYAQARVCVCVWVGGRDGALVHVYNAAQCSP